MGIIIVYIGNEIIFHNKLNTFFMFSYMYSYHIVFFVIINQPSGYIIIIPDYLHKLNISEAEGK